MKHVLKLLVCLTAIIVTPSFAANLPTGYTELEYLESTGTQYIDTGVSGFNTGTWEVYAKWMITTQTQTTSYPNVFSVYNGEDYNSYRVINKLQDSTSYYVSGNSRAGGGSTLVENIAINQIHEATARNGSVTIDGVVYNTPTQGSTLPADKTMGIFAKGDGKGKIQARIYSAWATKNGVLQYNLVPAKYVSGNTTTYGMYDTVRDTFLTNAGTGTFTAGPEVANSATSCNGTIVNYTSATGTVTQNGTPTPTNPIEPVFYKQGDMVLRKINDTYYDSYDATTGKITRRVGVKVFNGNESFTIFNANTYIKSDASDVAYLFGSDIPNATIISNALRGVPVGTSIWGTVGYPNTTVSNSMQLHMNIANDVLGITDYTQETRDSVITKAKAFLKRMYDAGTPVTVYYPLATATEEDWAAEQCIVSDGIKIATTKYTEDAFANLVTTLNSAITKVTNIVDTTVQQATEIGNLATTKQDRPDTDCPAGRKCLLIMGADNKPHWYLIQE